MGANSLTHLKLKCENCGCDEFITKPNRYDFYKLVSGKLVFQNSEFVEQNIRLFCRECSEEIRFEENKLAI